MRKRVFTLVAFLVLLGILTGCSSPGSSSLQALTDEQQETIFTEFYISLLYTSSLESTPPEITISGDTMTFDNYQLPSTYDQELEESIFGAPQYIGSGSVIDGTIVGSDTSGSVDVIITDPDIPNGEVTIEMETSYTNDSFSISLWVNGNEIDTQEAEDLFNELMGSQDEFGEVSNPVSQAVGTTIGYELFSYDVNWVSFPATAGETYIIETHEADDNVDTVMVLRDSNGNDIEENDDGGASLYSQITFTANSNGTYYIGVIEYSGCPGNYALSILDSPTKRE